uniref:Non-structural maintenance of chromosomes element 4 n=1 Tax=Kwoniella dejecticola CBS 10117 TaxID=1296121 RepID=A0A1A5ZY12_9TREE|nr:uncharacterized protein I303_07468 [Kwoniella dejecticola CBS 10117]OBR82701.1 hypothetical protein I303_07468 [Kwoniella dejecticola CBS 10117]
MSAEAGPSRPRHTTQNGHSPMQTNHDDRPLPTQKRRKITDVNEIFEKPDIEEQMKLNKEYRALQNQAEVRDTGIGTLDANLMKTNTENAMALAKKFKIDGVNFDIDEFFIKLKGHLGLDRIELADQDQPSDDDDDEDDELDESLQARGGGKGARKGVLGDWEKIGWMAAKYYRRIPGVEFMYGPLSKIHEKKQVGPRQKKKALAPEVRPEEVQQENGKQKSKDDFTSNVKIVKKVLSQLDPGGEGINFFELVIHPDDFGQSVENCFFVSFLLNQGLAGMDLANDGRILIKDTEPPDEMDGEHIVKNQAVVELDIQTWKDAKRIFNITKPSIPHRDYTAVRKQMAGNAWYS